MEEQINEHLSQLQTWKRIFFMLIFAVVVTIVRWLAWAVVLLQLVFVLLSGKKNENIVNFGRSLAIYAYHILLFLTFSTETLPFPFSPWNMSADLKSPKS
ncbi:MAG TPA: DUF4389 domain-containing protein [Methylococcaceae bacterium]|nr:DUF4389 domain-containing protein [Methylococcaceae bacterium]